MNVRYLVALIAAFSWFCTLGVRSSAGDVTRPNLLFLLMDDQRADSLGCMGNHIIQTPNIDALAQEGVTFDHAFVTTSICCVSRASILTGQYAARNRVNDFKTSFTPAQLARTYPARLKRAGYRIGFIGKWGVGQPPVDFFDYDKAEHDLDHYMVNVTGQTRHVDSVAGDQAIEFLKGCSAARAFCLSVSFKSPHAEDSDPRQYIYDPALEELYKDVIIPPPPLSDASFFQSLPQFLQKSESRRRWELRFATPEAYQQSVKAYYRLISGADRAIGRIVQQLRTQGLADSTIIVFSSDNGAFLGERGLADKWYPHEASIRIPLIVSDPRLPAAQRGTRRGQMALNIDIAPTLLDFAGLDAPSEMQGRSLAPFVRGDSPAAWREEFYYEHLFEHPHIPRTIGLRTTRWKYIRYIDAEPTCEELYDLNTDHDEANNLVNDRSHSEVLNELRRECDQWRERVK